MYKIGKMPQAVDIGYVGETNFRKLEIDMKDWMRLMPEGVPSIVCIRPGETKADAYVAVTTFEDDVLTWVITAADIGTQEGEGEIQIWLEEEENSSVIKRGKSVKVKTRVNDSANDPSPDTPTSEEAFIEQVTSMKTAAVNAKTAAETAQGKAEDAQEAAEQAAEDAEAAVVHQPYIDSTSKHWMVWDNETEAYVDTEILAEGHTPVRGTDYWTQQDQTAVVAAAAQATAGEIIDDTAGEGATGKTWSANKLDETTGLLLNDIQGKYEKPSGGIPSTDMTQAVQDALADAESAYQKPSGGIPASDIADGVIPVVDSALSYSSENAVQNKVVKGALDTKAPVIINTATGNPTVFNDGGGMPIKSLLIQITLKQTGSGDPSPVNIRPIVPWNGLTIFQSGADTSNPTETDIVFPSPVCVGTLDVVSGVLTVTHALLTKNTEDMNNGEDYPGWKNSGIEDIIGTGVNELLRNVLTNVSPVSNLSVGANTAYSGDVLYLNKSFFNKTQSEWKALAIDIQILVPLATTQAVTLTPTQITTLIGDNTIWSDTDGLLTVTYPANTALFIENQHRNFIAPELSSMIADTALVKNDFRIVGNNLYKITTAIASGGTLTPNTNCVKTTLAEVIKPLLT